MLLLLLFPVSYIYSKDLFLIEKHSHLCNWLCIEIYYNMGIWKLLFIGLSLCGGAGDWTQGYMFEHRAICLRQVPYHWPSSQPQNSFICFAYVFIFYLYLENVFSRVLLAVRIWIEPIDVHSSVVISLFYSCLPFWMMSKVSLDDGKWVVMGTVISYFHSLSILLSDHLRPAAPWNPLCSPSTVQDTSHLLAPH